uniref:Gag-pol polyprotein n=1 Tax=Musa acuminata subsp. malaccensis TaxID=214687 RepID=A0A804KSD6_MUSAM
MVEVSDLTQARGKLAPNWEGPYQVYDVVQEGTYRLETIEGNPLLRTWNTANLKKFYP